jgi:hypothetical protein
MGGGSGTVSTRRIVSRGLVVVGVVALAAAVSLALLPVQPFSCGSLLAPAFPHSEPRCVDAQTMFVPVLAICGSAGLVLLVSGVIALPARRRSRRPRFS